MSSHSAGAKREANDTSDQWTQAYAIVRRDHFPGHTYDPDDSSPPSICGGEYSYTVKEVVLNEAVAVKEIERLNALAGGEATRYFWQGTRLFADGVSFGGEPESDESR